MDAVTGAAKGGNRMNKLFLRPCPFCGGVADFTDLGVEGEFEDWDVECTECGITVITPGEEPGCVTTKEEAVRAWNRRASDDRNQRH